MQAITIKDVYNKIFEIEKRMITKEGLSEYLETFEILSNPETFESIKRSREDIKKGRVKKIDNVQDMLKQL